MLSLSEVVVVDLEAYLFLQCSLFGEVDLLDLEARVIVSLMLRALILSEEGVVDLEANLFFAVLSF